MVTQPDFREWLECLNARGAEYVVVGAHALAFHGVVRYTGDLDVLVRATPENARTVISALADFGFGSLELREEDFADPDRVVQLGFPPVRIDLITSLSGVPWEQAWEGRVAGDYGGVPVCFLGRDELVRNKQASGRLKDLADLEALGELVE
ncbi:MAG: hypothetical protein RBU45_20935 [Myxococcota bacterium]|jgi:hypothetical protein|nr:hypothetical protein [Myxococcota bacterium]